MEREPLRNTAITESESECLTTASSSNADIDMDFVFASTNRSISDSTSEEQLQPNESWPRSSSVFSSFTSISTPSTDGSDDNIILLFLFKDNSFHSQSTFIEQQLKGPVKSSRYFSEISSCIDYIRMAPRRDRIFVITHSAKEGKELIDICSACLWLKGVYVFEQEPTNELTTNTCIHYFNDWNALVQELNADMLPWRRQSLAFRFFEQKQSTIKNVTGDTASFMWSLILLNVLKEIPYSKQTTDDMLDMCADYYRDNQAYLAMIEKFRSTYESYDAIRWYTRDTFIYHRLNAALRTEDIDALILFRPFIVDLCSQIEEEQRCRPFLIPKVTVYHGQRMSMEEIEKLHKNKGNLVSTNAFWSSSLDKEVAVIYAGEGQPRPDRWSVIVQIDVPTNLESIVYARIDQLSYMQDEREVLFSLSAVFKIINVYQDTHQKCWCVHLEGTDEGRESFIEYGRLLRHDTEETNIHIIFGDLIMGMGKYDKACSYWANLAKRLPADDVNLQGTIRQKHGRALFFIGKYSESLAIISDGLAMYNNTDLSFENPNYLRLQFNLANVYMFTGRFTEALELYEKVLKIQQKIFQPDHRHIADSFCGISWAYQRKHNHKLALDYCLRGLDIFQRILPPNHPTIFKALTALGGLLEMSGQWDMAYDELKRALDTCRRFLPNDHDFIANILRDIGGIHANRGEIDLAFDYYQKVLDIRQRNFPNGHIMIANILTVIADLHRRRKEFKQAIELHERSDEMRKQLWPPGTPIHKHRLALIYLDMGDSAKAIELFKFTYDIFSERNNEEPLSICRTLSCLATAYSHHGDLELSCKTFERALSKQQICFPNGHPDIGVTLHHMGSNFWRMKNYQRAMECYRDSVNMLERFMQPTHFEIKSVKEKLQRLEQTFQ